MICTHEKKALSSQAMHKGTAAMNPRRCVILLTLIAGAVGLPAADGPTPPPAEPAIEARADEVIFTSRWLKVAFSTVKPQMNFLSVDALGGGQHGSNLLKAPLGGRPGSPVAEGVRVEVPACSFSRTGTVVRYTGIKLNASETDSLTFTLGARSIAVLIERDIREEYTEPELSPWRMMFDATVSCAAPLGRLVEDEKGSLRFPVLLHFPDRGSLLVRATDADKPESLWRFSLWRDFKRCVPGAVAPWVPMTPEFRARTEKLGNTFRLGYGKMHLGPEQIELALHQGRGTARQAAGKRFQKLDMTVTAVYPEKTLVDADAKLAGIKRAWLNIFGFRADLACLANNSTGDTCQFCIHCYADQASHTPPLFDDFTALDLVRISLDTYFKGFKGYADHFQDVAPSTLIAAWVYATGKPDMEWLQRNIGFIEQYAARIIAADTDGDGLCESEEGPTNWWDCIPWDGKDAYSSALAFRAFRCIADLEHRLGDEAKAASYRQRADQIKAVYFKTFYNPDTGVLAGWRTNKGVLQDHYYLFANGIAISYGLVDKAQADAILDKLQAKIKEVGFTSFHLGLPGNLLTFPNDDHLAFQCYENGGVTGSMAYHYVQALYAAGRGVEADAIFMKMLEGYRDGNFQNGIGNGGDWKEWDGRPNGYEGLLVDAYYPLTAWITGRLGRGVQIP